VDKATNNLLARLQKTLRDHMNQQSDFLTEGTAEDYATYKYSCGIIYGLSIAERELLDLNEIIDKD
jgi:hypothetical protein